MPRVPHRNEARHVLPEDLVEHEGLAKDGPVLLPKIDRVDGLDEDRQGVCLLRTRQRRGVEVTVIAGEARGASRLVDQDRDGGIVGQDRPEARPRLRGARGRKQALRGELVDRGRVMVEHDELMPMAGDAPPVHGREIPDEGHGDGFEPEIGHEQHFGRRSLLEPVQLGRHDGTDIRIARHMHDPGDVGMGGGYRRSAVAVEIMVGELRDVHDVGDFRSGPDPDRIRPSL